MLQQNKKLSFNQNTYHSYKIRPFSQWTHKENNNVSTTADYAAYAAENKMISVLLYC